MSKNVSEQSSNPTASTANLTAETRAADAAVDSLSQFASPAKKAGGGRVKNRAPKSNKSSPKRRKSSQRRRVKQMRFSLLPDEYEQVERMAKPFGSVSNFVRLKIGLINLYEANSASRKSGFSPSLSTIQSAERRAELARYAEELSGALIGLRMASTLDDFADAELGKTSGIVSDRTVETFVAAAAALLAEYRGESKVVESAAAADLSTATDEEAGDDLLEVPPLE